MGMGSVRADPMSVGCSGCSGIAIDVVSMAPISGNGNSVSVCRAFPCSSGKWDSVRMIWSIAKHGRGWRWISVTHYNARANSSANTFLNEGKGVCSRVHRICANRPKLMSVISGFRTR